MSDLFGGNYQPMVLQREDNGTLTIVDEGTELQVVSRDALRELVRDFNTVMARVDIWKDKWRRAEDRYREVSELYWEQRRLNEAQEEARWSSTTTTSQDS